MVHPRIVTLCQTHKRSTMTLVCPTATGKALAPSRPRSTCRRLSRSPNLERLLTGLGTTALAVALARTGRSQWRQRDRPGSAVHGCDAVLVSPQVQARPRTPGRAASGRRRRAALVSPGFFTPPPEPRSRRAARRQRGDYGQVIATSTTATLTGSSRGQRSFQPAPVAAYSSTRACISAFRSSVGSTRL